MRLHPLLILIIIACSASGCINAPISLMPSRGPLQEETLQPAARFWTRDKIAVLDLSGSITSGGGGGLLGGDSTVVRFKEQLMKVEKDPRVRAVALRIDSPGGEVTASDVIYREVTRFREDTGIPVYAAMMDVAASGAYYIAMAADRVYASPTTVTGSIGVIMLLPKLEDLADKVGVEMRVIKSGTNKDLGSPWRDMDPDERAVLQGIIDDYYNRFIGIVAAGRPQLSPERVRELADGRVYTAEQALDKGLIDGIRYLDQVIDEAKRETGLSDARVVTYRPAYGYKGNIYAGSNVGIGAPSLVSIDAGRLLEPFTRPRFQYLWMP